MSQQHHRLDGQPACTCRGREVASQAAEAAGERSPAYHGAAPVVGPDGDPLDLADLYKRVSRGFSTEEPPSGDLSSFASISAEIEPNGWEEEDTGHERPSPAGDTGWLGPLSHRIDQVAERISSTLFRISDGGGEEAERDAPPLGTRTELDLAPGERLAEVMLNQRGSIVTDTSEPMVFMPVATPVRRRGESSRDVGVASLSA
jgi:hypothetical protein